MLGAHAKLEKETQNASLTLASTIDEARNDLAGDLRALEVKVEGKVQKSIDTMSTSLEAMNTRVKKEMEPKLAATTGKLETLETRVMLEQDELKTGMTKSLEAMSTELDELSERVDGMEAGLDINALLMGAASGSGS